MSDIHHIDQPILDATAGMDIEDREWFRKAVFYAVLIRSFQDSNDDGIGDLAGLTQRLDYLQWLGIDCLVLPPLFPSPLTDGGYDVLDFYAIDPTLGSVDEFRQFVATAHARGLRVVLDFVLNHTSDQHPWFQHSRAEPGGPFGDFYVWREGVAANEPTAYAGARLLHPDTEHSNWASDEVRGQYYWHRFRPNQPDLNLENPHVLEEIKNAMRFWLALDVDGFRFDSVPYLVEQDGTDSENLPGTHRILKELRALIDEEFPGRILICEADQPAATAIDYFGAGDEAQMVLHFPLLPRLFLGLCRGSRLPISNLLALTSVIPAGCQWGTFLRNHNELALAMVTDAEREELWAAYAPDPRMISNLGIRRRLAPLLGGDAARILLVQALLLSLPGSPILYYGDEIGMGDNIWLPDRDAVRTPMQWTADTHSEPVPPDSTEPRDHGAHYARVNVEDQALDPGSLLVRLRSLLSLRRRHQVFGTGDFTDLGGDNDAVLSFLRSDPDGLQPSVLCLTNLSPTSQAVSLDLARFAGETPVDLLRDVEHDTISTDPFMLEVPGHRFLWLRLPPVNQ